MAAVKKIFDEIIQTDHKVITEETSKSILKRDPSSPNVSCAWRISVKNASLIWANTTRVNDLIVASATGK
ncbi:hypothetical protein, partial [Salmonella sp. s59944]|uniref:hypothetical protein n=1 Tax=Salmonella sp. s59944 TaxID=3159720 RepID=UPI00398168B7